MIFSIVILVLVGGIAFFHWVQGLFSSAISMVLALIAAVFAIGYSETIIASFLGGRVADLALGMVMCATFAAIYGVGRLLFDSLVPGNVRLPVYVDRIGGGVCGIVTGIAATGVLAVAAQSMPFGVSLLGYSRYELEDDKEATVTVPGMRSQQTVLVSNALKDDVPDPEKDQELMLATDRMIVNFVAFQSESGALAGGVSFKEQHPNFLRELFFQRVGIEPGAKHSALNIGGKKEVDVVEVFAPASLPQVDAEMVEIRSARKLTSPLKADANKAIVVVRTTVEPAVTDKDKRFRVSPGQVRLVASGRNFHPIGTLFHPGNVIVANRVDDYLIVDAGNGGTIDFVFLVDRADVLEGAAGDGKTPAAMTMKPGAFLEVKRFARVDLTDKAVTTASTSGPHDAESGGVLRKAEVRERIQTRAGS